MGSASRYFGALTVAFLIAAAPTMAQADFEIEVVIKNHRFVPDRIEVPRDAKVRLKVINQDDVAEEFESFVLNREKLVPPGGTVVIFLPKLKPGTYEFFGEFHESTARGIIVVP